MKPDDIPVVTSSDQTLPGITDAAPPSDHALDVNAVGRRILAFVIDTVIVYFVVSVVSALFSLSDSLDMLFRILGFFVYKISTEALRGETLGKRFLSISVRELSGRPIGWIPSTVRNVMLIPGAFLLFIPSLAMMEFSPTKQRLGDRMAKTIVVRVRQGPLGTGRVDPTTELSIVPTVEAEVPLVVAQSRRGAEDWRWLAAGSVALAATTIIATMILTIDLTICGQAYGRFCEGDFDAPVWSGSRSAHILAIVSATLALIAIPFSIGWVVQKWVWTFVSGCVCSGAFVIAVIMGIWIVSKFYADYTSASTDNAGAGIAYFTLLIVGSPVPTIFALLGIFAGMGVDKLRA